MLARLRAVCIWVLILPIRGYRMFFSPWLGHSCRFQPTCSAYAIEALERHGPVRGLFLTLRRLGRCNPWGGSGFDPVPSIADKRAEK
ncbi:MAG: membrane protein insertion efficiency factor YidD [Pseudomonadota bacterium]